MFRGTQVNPCKDCGVLCSNLELHLSVCNYKGCVASVQVNMSSLLSFFLFFVFFFVKEYSKYLFVLQRATLAPFCFLFCSMASTTGNGLYSALLKVSCCLLAL